MKRTEHWERFKKGGTLAKWELLESWGGLKEDRVLEGNGGSLENWTDSHIGHGTCMAGRGGKEGKSLTVLCARQKPGVQRGETKVSRGLLVKRGRIREAVILRVGEIGS